MLQLTLHRQVARTSKGGQLHWDILIVQGKNYVLQNALGKVSFRAVYWEMNGSDDN